MAVEARNNLNLFLPQLLGNREIMNPVDGNGSFYSTQMGYVAGAPGIVAAGDGNGNGNGKNATLVPMYGCSAVKSDSGVTYNLPVISRKRSRIESEIQISQTQKRHALFSFLGEDVSVQVQQSQFDIDRLVSQHIEKLRIEIGERRKLQARQILESLQERIGNRLREKDEEIEKMRKLNWALEEKVQSLSIETQIWRDLAQSNEAAANALRAHLEHAALARHAAGAGEDAESCCGSSAAEDGGAGGGEGRCRSCGKEESCVLLLPCRHLCLCTGCGSTLHVCPICRSVKNASLHVNTS